MIILLNQYSNNKGGTPGTNAHSCTFLLLLLRRKHTLPASINIIQLSSFYIPFTLHVHSSGTGKSRVAPTSIQVSSMVSEHSLARGVPLARPENRNRQTHTGNTMVSELTEFYIISLPVIYVLIVLKGKEAMRLIHIYSFFHSLSA